MVRGAGERRTLRSPLVQVTSLRLNTEAVRRASEAHFSPRPPRQRAAGSPEAHSPARRRQDPKAQGPRAPARTPALTPHRQIALIHELGFAPRVLEMAVSGQAPLAAGEAVEALHTHCSRHASRRGVGVCVACQRLHDNQPHASGQASSYIGMAAWRYMARTPHRASIPAPISNGRRVRHRAAHRVFPELRNELEPEVKLLRSRHQRHRGGLGSPRLDLPQRGSGVVSEAAENNRKAALR
ncbi:hypothetical protein Vafri_250 [Volvox africanus]|nr:hypothetical protein Vafri_250 [Volvox africanus]